MSATCESWTRNSKQKRRADRRQCPRKRAPPFLGGQGGCWRSLCPAHGRLGVKETEERGLWGILVDLEHCNDSMNAVTDTERTRKPRLKHALRKWRAEVAGGGTAVGMPATAISQQIVLPLSDSAEHLRTGAATAQTMSQQIEQAQRSQREARAMSDSSTETPERRMGEPCIPAAICTCTSVAPSAPLCARGRCSWTAYESYTAGSYP